MNKLIVFILLLVGVNQMNGQVHFNSYLVNKDTSNIDTLKGKEVIFKYYPIYKFRIKNGEIIKERTPIKILVLETFNKRIDFFYEEKSIWWREKPDEVLEIISEETDLRRAYVKTDYFSAKGEVEQWEIFYSLKENGNIEHILFQTNMWTNDKKIWLGVEETYDYIMKRYLNTSN